MAIWTRFSRGWPAVLGLALLGACVDQPMEPPIDPRPALGATILCAADVRAETVTCGEGSPATNAGLSILVGGYGRYTRILPTRVFFNEDTRTLHSWMAVQSLIVQPLGTSDGSVATGMRVLVTSGPAATVGRGDVSVLNPDGTADATARGQPYFAYDGLLRLRQSTTAKRWAFRVAPGVERFEFQLLVDAQIPLPDGVLGWSHVWMGLGTPPQRPWGVGTTIYAVGPGVLRSTDAGATWQSHVIPGLSPVDLWGDADSAVYVAGRGARDSTVILRAEAGRWGEWSRVGASRSAFQAVWGSSATDIYGIRGDSIFHSADGRTWTGGAVAGGPTVIFRQLNRIWGSGPGHVYAAGWEFDQVEVLGLLLHSTDDGRTWREHRFSRLRRADPSPQVRLNAVWGLGNGHLWVGGVRSVDAGFIAHSADYGASWTEYEVGATITGIWGSSPENVYAVNNLHGAYAFNGRSWFSLDAGEWQPRGFTDVWGSSDGSIILFGDARELYRGVR
jgi:hypothetical protein